MEYFYTLDGIFKKMIPRQTCTRGGWILIGKWLSQCCKLITYYFQNHNMVQPYSRALIENGVVDAVNLKGVIFKIIADGLVLR